MYSLHPSTCLPFLLTPYALQVGGLLYGTLALLVTYVLCTHGAARLSNWKSEYCTNPKTLAHTLFICFMVPLMAIGDFGLVFMTILYVAMEIHRLSEIISLRHIELIVGLFVVIPIILFGWRRRLLFVANVLFLIGVMGIMLRKPMSMILNESDVTPTTNFTRVSLVDQNQLWYQSVYEFLSPVADKQTFIEETLIVPERFLLEVSTAIGEKKVRDELHLRFSTANLQPPGTDSAEKAPADTLGQTSIGYFERVKLTIQYWWSQASLWVSEIRRHPKVYVESACIFIYLFSTSIYNDLDSYITTKNGSKRKEKDKKYWIVGRPTILLLQTILFASLVAMEKAGDTKLSKLKTLSKIFVNTALLLMIPERLVGMVFLFSFMEYPRSCRSNRNIQSPLCESLIFNDENPVSRHHQLAAAFDVLHCNHCEIARKHVNRLLKILLIFIALLLLTETDWDIYYWISTIAIFTVAPLILVLPQILLSDFTGYGWRFAFLSVCGDLFGYCFLYALAVMLFQPNGGK